MAEEAELKQRLTALSAISCKVIGAGVLSTHGRALKSIKVRYSRAKPMHPFGPGGQNLPTVPVVRIVKS
jgi:hypothetical protein